MASIPSSGTTAERVVRSFLHRQGLRFGRSDRLPGRPDVVLPRHRAVVLVQGCLWHGHAGCSRARIPKSNVAMWEEKVRRNRERDARVAAQLVAMGWRVLEVWTCDLRASARREAALRELAAAVTGEVSQARRTLVTV